MVSSASVSRNSSGFGEEQSAYFKRIAEVSLKNPQIVGFGISNYETFTQATQFAKGAIIGSVFIKHLTKRGISKISEFIDSILS